MPQQAATIGQDVADPRVKPEGRNGHYRRHLLGELGDIELAAPRTRRYCPVEVVRANAGGRRRSTG